MDRWKYVTESGRKESGFEKLENKISRLQSFKKAGKANRME